MTPLLVDFPREHTREFCDALISANINYQIETPVPSPGQIWASGSEIIRVLTETAAAFAALIAVLRSFKTTLEVTFVTRDKLEKWTTNSDPSETLFQVAEQITRLSINVGVSFHKPKDS